MRGAGLAGLSGSGHKTNRGEGTATQEEREHAGGGNRKRGREDLRQNTRSWPPRAAQDGAALAVRRPTAFRSPLAHFALKQDRLPCRETDYARDEHPTG